MTLIFFGLMLSATLIFFALLKIAEYTDDLIEEKLLISFWIIAMFLIYAGASIEGLL
jgi:hypothetical protein